MSIFDLYLIFLNEGNFFWGTVWLSLIASSQLQTSYIKHVQSLTWTMDMTVRARIQVYIWVNKNKVVLTIYVHFQHKILHKDTIVLLDCFQTQNEYVLYTKYICKFA